MNTANEFYTMRTVLLFLAITSFPVHESLAQWGPVPSGPGADCFSSWSRTSERVQRDVFDIVVDGDSLRGTLYLPDDSHGRMSHPAMLFLPGGGTDASILSITPTWFGRHLAHCGIAVAFLDKRGTGRSMGDATVMTMDDLLNDAGHALEALRRHPHVDSLRVGVMGGSQGGRLAPVLAARDERVAAVVSISGPLSSVRHTRLYALEQAFLNAGVTPGLVDTALVYWDRHLALHAESSPDPALVASLDADLQALRPSVPAGLLPPNWSDRERNEIMNSMGLDVMEPLSRLTAPWLSLYGAADPVVPVAESLRILHMAMTVAGNRDIAVRVYPDANHNLVHTPTRSDTPFERELIDWLYARFGLP